MRDSRCSVPARLYAPLIMDSVFGYQSVNVESAGTIALFAAEVWMRRMIALRQQHPDLRPRHSWRCSAPRTAASSRSSARLDGEAPVLVVANLASTMQPASLDLSAYAGRTPVEMTGGTTLPPITEGAVLPDAGAVRVLLAAAGGRTVTRLERFRVRVPSSAFRVRGCQGSAVQGQRPSDLRNPEPQNWERGTPEPGTTEPSQIFL